MILPPGIPVFLCKLIISGDDRVIFFGGVEHHCGPFLWGLAGGDFFVKTLFPVFVEPWGSETFEKLLFSVFVGPCGRRKFCKITIFSFYSALWTSKTTYFERI